MTAATDAAALLADCEREGVPEEYRAAARDVVGRIRREFLVAVVVLTPPTPGNPGGVDFDFAEAALAEAQRRGWVP